MTQSHINPYQAPSSETLFSIKRIRPRSPKPPWLLGVAVCIAVQVALVYVATILSNRLTYPPGIVLTALNIAFFVVASIWSGLRYRLALAHGFTQLLNVVAWSVDLLTIWFMMGKLSISDISIVLKTSIVFGVIMAIVVQLIGALGKHFGKHLGEANRQQDHPPN